MGGWETNTLVSDTTMVICLDDYHLNDRGGRKVTGRTALDLAENNFDLMYEQLKELKSGNAIKKPIYNHVNGTLDTPEEITPTQIVTWKASTRWPILECVSSSTSRSTSTSRTTSSSPGRSRETWSSAATRSSRSSSPSKPESPTSTRSSRRSAATPTSSSRCYLPI